MQALADEIYSLMVAQAALFAIDTPIRQSLTNLSAFLGPRRQSTPEAIGQLIEAALATDSRFAREEARGEVRFITSRQGTYVPRNEVDTHSFKQRLQDPDHPLPIDDISVVVSTSRPAITTVEPVYISDYWQIQAGVIPSGQEQMDSAVSATPELDVAALTPVSEADAQPLPVFAEMNSTGAQAR